ncbi:MAG: hypothetical protein H7239_11705 [Flavobacterium sp.]|nr:hypothetical protein [Flavobacterium sp.]
MIRPPTNNFFHNGIVVKNTNKTDENEIIQKNL